MRRRLTRPSRSAEVAPVRGKRFGLFPAAGSLLASLHILNRVSG